MITFKYEYPSQSLTDQTLKSDLKDLNDISKTKLIDNYSEL